MERIHLGLIEGKLFFSCVEMLLDIKKRIDDRFNEDESHSTGITILLW